MTDKTIFNGDEDDQFLHGEWNPPAEPEFKPSAFGKIMGRVVAFAITMVAVAGCVWLVAAIIANLPTR